jgi:hypothetical protein
VWFLIFDAVKLLLYRPLDPERTVMHGPHDLRCWRRLRSAISL